jgi:predicted AAA+ superfamily ATPase
MSDSITLEDIYKLFERSQAQADKQLKAVKAIAAKAMQSVDALSSRWGRFVENLVAPGAVRLFQARGIAVKEVHQRVRATRGSLPMEVDVLAVDDTVAVEIEVKSRLTQKQISEFIENLRQFKVAFPAYQNYEIYGAVAGIEIDAGADRYAYKPGLFMIKQSGETVEIDNDENFKPTLW